jgi:chlorobactene glucosyltransferase
MWLVTMLQVAVAFRRVGEFAPPGGNPGSKSKVTVIIPARNEELDLEAALRSVLAQDGVDLEVILVNDHSVDRTRAIAEGLAHEFPNLRVLNDPPLREGWLGKSSAMQTAAAVAKGDYLLFTDADIFHGPGILKYAVAHMQENRLDFLSLMPEFRMKPFWENVIVPMYFSGFARYASPSIDDPGSPDALAFGAFMLVRASVFRQTGGFEAVKGEMFDDVGLARNIKQSGHRVSARLAPKWLGVSLFKDNIHAFWGTTKNVLMIAEGRPYLALFAALLSVFLFWTPPLAVVTGIASGCKAAVIAGVLTYLLQYGLMFLGRKMASMRPFPLLFFPLVVIVVFFCTFRALYYYYVKGSIVWRGRTIRVR